MINQISLYQEIRRYRVTEDKDLPVAYQDIPGGRPLHDDFGIMSNNPILKALQPWQRIRRIDTAFKTPLPFKIISGEKRKPVWRLWDTNYPTSPGTEIKEMPVGTPGGTFMLPHALCDEGGFGPVRYAVYLPHLNDWVECFYQYKKIIFGRRYMYYNGLKQDLTVDFFSDWTIKSDLLAWFPEISMSWKRGT